MLVARQQQYVIAHTMQTDDVLAPHHARPEPSDTHATNNGRSEEHGLVQEVRRYFNPGLFVARPHWQIAVHALGFARHLSKGGRRAGGACWALRRERYRWR